MTTMADQQKHDYLEFAQKLARDAGKVIHQYFLAEGTEWKSDNTPVTVADRQINTMVVERVSQAFPDHSVLGEEQSSNLGQQFVWVCDPVDGTLPYAHGVPVASFSLALCDDGVPVVGVVYDPFQDRLFHAVVGQGAFCNNEPIQVNQNNLQGAVISLEDVNSMPSVISIDPQLRQALYSNGAKPLSLNATTLPTTMIASGQFTAAIFNFAKPEDGAAAKVIVEEAGGKLTDLYGNEQRFDQPINGFVASNGQIHDELIQMIKEKSNEV